MSEPGTASNPETWILFAREDLRAAEAQLGSDEFVPRHSCFLAQQAAEKAIKAALIHQGIDFPYRHDLEHLYLILPAELQFDRTAVDLEALTTWVVVARYPGDLSIPSIDDARAAIRDASYILESIERYLGLQP